MKNIHCKECPIDINNKLVFEKDTSIYVPFTLIFNHNLELRRNCCGYYIVQGDQASIVGGAIEFVKELEHILQSLESKKFILLQQQQRGIGTDDGGCDGEAPHTTSGEISAPTTEYFSTPFAQFFSYPQYTCSQIPNKYTSKSKAAIADIEVTLIETHANVRILSRRRFRQLSKLVAAFQSLYLTVLHLNVTTLDPLVLYSISAKVRF